MFATETNPYGGTSHGGAEMSMRVLARELANRGHVSFFATTGVCADDRKKALEEGVELIAIPSKFKSRLRLVRNLAYRCRNRHIVTAVRKVKPDLLYCSYELNILAALIRARKKSSNNLIVMRVAGKAYRDFSRKSPAYKEKFISLSSEVDAINHVHGYLEKDYRNFLLEGNPRSILPKSFICDLGSTYLMKVSRKKQYNKNKVSLVMVARFSSYQKRQDILVDAFEKLKTMNDYRLLLIGDGSEKERIKNRVVELGVEDRVEFGSFLPQDALWQRLAECDLLVHATEHEGRSKIISEAMAAGLPVLASDVPPINWDIKDGVNGFLVGNTPEQWARKIVEVLADPERMEEVAQTARDSSPSSNEDAIKKV